MYTVVHTVVRSESCGRVMHWPCSTSADGWLQIERGWMCREVTFWPPNRVLYGPLRIARIDPAAEYEGGNTAIRRGDVTKVQERGSRQDRVISAHLLRKDNSIFGVWRPR